MKIVSLNGVRMEVGMKRLRGRIKKVLNAIAFAKSDEHTSGTGVMETDGNEQELPVASETLFKASNPGRGGFLRKMQAYSAAAAFAEEGAFDWAREMICVEKRIPRILLVIEGEAPDPSTLRYARNLCKRMEARLDILLVSDREEKLPADANGRISSSAVEKISTFLENLANDGTLVNTYVKPGDVNETMYRHLKEHKEIAAVVYDLPSIQRTNPKDGRWRKTIDRICNQLSIPLVSVLGKQESDARGSA